LEPLVRSGAAVCARCGEPIGADEPWDLGHCDETGRATAGPVHRARNRATSGRRAAASWVPADDPENGVFWGPPNQWGTPLR